MKFVHVLLVGLLAFACGWIGFLLGDQRMELSRLRDSHTSLLEGLSRQVDDLSHRLDDAPALAREREELPHSVAALREVAAAARAGAFRDDGYFGWTYARVHEVFGRPQAVRPEAGTVSWSYLVESPEGDSGVLFQFVDGVCTAVRVQDG